MNYLSDYQTFTNKHEMNEAVALHLSHNQYILNSTEKEVLAILSRYSVKFAGVSHLKHETIADKLNKSTRTIQRSIKRLEELHIVKKQSFYRKVTGGYGANLYIILPFNSSSVVSEVSHRTTKENHATPTTHAPKSDNEPYSFFKQNNFINNTYTEAVLEVPQTYYSRFKRLIESFLGEGNQKLVSSLFGIYKAQSIQTLKWDIFSDKKVQLEALAIHSLSITIQSTKKKHIKSLTGYFSGTFKKLIDRELYELEALESTENENKPLFGYVNNSGEFIMV